MHQEGRILTRDWSLYDGENVVIRPKKMTPEQLDEGMRRARREFYSLRSMATRLWRARTKPHISGVVNLAYAFVARRQSESRGVAGAGASTFQPTHEEVVGARMHLPVFNGWS